MKQMILHLCFKTMKTAATFKCHTGATVSQDYYTAMVTIKLGDSNCHGIATIDRNCKLTYLE